jgi:nitrite reductase (NADH) large subunit
MELPKTRPVVMAIKEWRCLVCNYIHQGDEPPDICPICAVGPELFELISPVEIPATAPATDGSSVRIAVVGMGVAGMTAVEYARKTNAKAEITAITREPGLPFYRINLTRLLANEVKESELIMQKQAWFDEHKISLHYGEVKEIERAQRRLLLQDGTSITYDKLILCNGAHPFVPPVLGAIRDRVFTFRTLEDTHRITAAAKHGKRCVCIGGGLLGLETAGALRKQGLEVTVLEGFGWLLPRQLSEAAGLRLLRHVEGLGIKVMTSVQVDKILGDEAVAALQLKDGTEIPADLVVISAGIRANSYLARQCGLNVGNGILVNDQMLTSDPQIFAAGDVCEHRNLMYGNWPAAYAQGVVAGINAAGGDVEFKAMAPSNRLKVLDIDLFSAGIVNPPDDSYVALDKQTEDQYTRLVCRNGKLIGAILMGNTESANALTEAIESQTDISESPNLLDNFPIISKVI